MLKYTIFKLPVNILYTITIVRKYIVKLFSGCYEYFYQLGII